MRFEYTTRKGNLRVGFDADNQKAAFKLLGEIQDVFEESRCGACKSDAIRFSVRSVGGNDYYEMRCAACTARLTYGQHKNGTTLFAKRKDADGNWDNKSFGWSIYQGKSDDD